MIKLKRVIILYPGETSYDQLKKPANYSLPRLIFRLAELKIDVYIINHRASNSKNKNISFYKFSFLKLVYITVLLMYRTGTLIISQDKRWDIYGFFLKRILRSKLVLRRGGIYYGKTVIDRDFEQNDFINYANLIRKSDHFLSTADGTSVKYYLEKIGLNESKYSILLNGFPEYDISIDAKRENTILCVARLSHEKGVDYVIRSFAKIYNQLNESYKLLIIGEGPEKSNLERLASSLGLRECIEFLGYKDNPIDFIASTKLLISGLSNNTIIESIVTKTPVIALELGEFHNLYGQYPNVQIIDYPLGGYGKIPNEFMDNLVNETCDKILNILNNYEDYNYTFKIEYDKLSWDKRINDEIDIYQRLVSR